MLRKEWENCFNETQMVCDRGKRRDDGRRFIVFSCFLFWFSWGSRCVGASLFFLFRSFLQFVALHILKSFYNPKFLSKLKIWQKIPESLLESLRFSQLNLRTFLYRYFWSQRKTADKSGRTVWTSGRKSLMIMGQASSILIP